jgi:adenine/guanine/hypoxanthine permease
MRWIERGDIDGFFGLALDNFVQLLLIDTLCRFVLGFPNELLYGRVMPGVAVSLLIGNVFYSWQARELARRTGRNDICALPYGINTVSIFGHVFLVMLPAKMLAVQHGFDDPARFAWQAGLMACLGSALIECGGAFVAERIRKATPRAALLSTLAGIAITFISLSFLFRTFARPQVGLVTLGIVLLVYFGGVRFKGRLPGGLVAVLVGTALSWIPALGVAPVGKFPEAGPQLYLPIPVVNDLLEAFRAGHLIAFISVIIPMGVFNVIGSLQNIESAEAAGDSFPTRSSLLVNGIGSLAAALFGSCFPTTLYIGHPGWKAMGARAGYSVLNGIFITAICLTGTLAHIAWAVPIDAGMAIVLWIGIVITAQAFAAVPVKHAPAVVVGLLPGVAAWGAVMAKNGLRAAGWGLPGGPAFDANAEKITAAFTAGETWIHGAFALEQGFIFTAMMLSAMTVAIIEKKFVAAGIWCFVATGVSLLGLMHSYQWTPGDTAVLLKPAIPWAVGYAGMGLVFLLARFITEPGEGH